MPENNKDLDLDREAFNPKLTRKMYEEEGFTPATIEALVELDRLIYEAPEGEVHAVMAAERGKK